MAKGGTALNFGTYGLKALEPERITARQIEAARRAITRAMKRAGRVWIRIFPDVPVSAQAGRGAHGLGQGLAGILGRAAWQPGRIMFEIDGVAAELAREALTLGAAKLPIKTHIRRPHRRRLRWPRQPRRPMSAPRRRTNSARMLLDLRKEQFNLRFQRATGQTRRRRPRARGAPRHRAGEDHPGGEDNAPPRKS